MSYSVLWNEDTAALQWGVVIVAALIGAIIDVAVRRIPNVVTGSLCMSGVAWALVVGGLVGMTESVLAVILLGAPFVFLWTLGVCGAGDAKLMAAIGAWLGLANGVIALSCVAIAGGLLGVAFTLAHRQVRPVFEQFVWMFWSAVLWANGTAVIDKSQWREVGAKSQMPAMPYGVAIFAGVVAAAIGVHLWNA